MRPRRGDFRSADSPPFPRARGRAPRALLSMAKIRRTTLASSSLISMRRTRPIPCGNRVSRASASTMSVARALEQGLRARAKRTRTTRWSPVGKGIDKRPAFDVVLQEGWDEANPLGGVYRETGCVGPTEGVAGSYPCRGAPFRRARTVSYRRPSVSAPARYDAQKPAQSGADESPPWRPDRGLPQNAP